MLSIVAKEKRCHIIDPFREYYNAERWSRTVERNIVDDLQYTSDSLWHRMQIIYPNMQAKLPRTFKIYVHLFALVALQHDISQLATKFLDYQAYILKEIVEPLLFRRMHVPVRSIVLVVRWIYWPFQYPVQMLKWCSEQEEAGCRKGLQRWKIRLRLLQVISIASIKLSLFEIY